MKISPDHYTPSDLKNWQGRKDSLPNERYFQHIKAINLREEDIRSSDAQAAIIGCCTDEGIRRNEGRIGAKAGPDALRQQLGKLACHHDKQYIDLGNLYCPDGNLEQAQAELGEIVRECHAHQLKTIVLGGGHDIAWGHFSGLTQHSSDIAIINFDAHFDLRPILPNAGGNSGTPFWQIAKHCQASHQRFHYLCLGIQPLANTNSLLQIAAENQVGFLTAEALHDNSLESQIDLIHEFTQSKSAIYLSVCLDVFNEALAPGVSAPQPLGIFPDQVIPLLKTILQTGKVIGIDIAELSPPLDQGEKTSRLAAMLLGTILECL